MPKEKNKSPLYAFGEGKSLPHQRNSSPLNQGEEKPDWKDSTAVYMGGPYHNNPNWKKVSKAIQEKYPQISPSGIKDLPRYTNLPDLLTTYKDVLKRYDIPDEYKK